MEIDNIDARSFNDFQGYLKFQYTWAYRKLINCPAKFIFMVCGNQQGKTGSVAHSYVSRIMGWHPIAKKNILYF